MAIDDSIRERRSVTLEAVLDSQEWVDIVAELDALSDDSAEHQGGDVEPRAHLDYWGTDDDGDEWRITVVATGSGV